MNPTIETLRAHRTIRRFRPGDLPTDTLERWVAAGQAASTSSHVQAYAAIRVTDERARARLVELTGGQPQVARCGAFLVICADARRHHLVCEDAGVPCVDNFESFLVATIDASLFAQNVVIAAESEGFGACYIGGLRNQLAAVIALLGIPEGVFPLYGLCLGEPESDEEGDSAVKPRLPVAAVLHEDRYPDDETMRAHIAEHDAEMAGHYAERGLPGRNWSGGVSRKLSQVHRPDLPDTYRGQGAQLEGGGRGDGGA